MTSTYVKNIYLIPLYKHELLCTYATENILLPYNRPLFKILFNYYLRSLNLQFQGRFSAVSHSTSMNYLEVLESEFEQNPLQKIRTSV